MDRLGYDVRERLLVITRTPQRRHALLRIGLGDADLRRLVRRGTLRHHHGHYVDGRLDEELAPVACAQAAYPGSVVSHFSAARLAGIPVWTDRTPAGRVPTGATWLTRPPEAPRNQRRADIVVRRAGLAPVDLSGHGWVPVTGVARTVVDLARELPLRESIVTVDGALRSGTTIDELHAVAERQHHWPGIRRAQHAIAFGNPSAESALESIARVRFAAAGLPAPLLQVQFFDGVTWMLERVDFWWPPFRTVGEADGLAKYEANSPAERRQLLRRSHRRDQRIGDRGVEVVHFGWEDVVDPRSDLIARLRAGFARGVSRTTEPPQWRAVPPPHADAA